MQTGIGKLRGLGAVSSEMGVFTILAFDHRQSFARMLPVEAGKTIGFDEIVAAKSSVVRALAPHASGVLLDPVYSAAQSILDGSLPGKVGLLVAVEETGYSGSTVARLTTLLPDWSAAKIKRMGADAVKLLIYYHPAAVDLTERQEQLTREVIEECRRLDIAFFLEAISYSIDQDTDKNSADFAKARPGLIRDIAARLGALEPDVLKLEFPVDVLYNREEKDWMRACEAVSQASPCPWAVLSAGVNFDLFKRQVAIACRCGASGYIAGRAVWQEGISMPPEQRERWLNEVAAPRLDQLAEIAGKHARPWREFLDDVHHIEKEDWYAAYPGMDAW